MPGTGRRRGATAGPPSRRAASLFTYRLRDFAKDRMPLALDLQRWKPGMSSARHLHDCVEIIYVLKGGGVNVVNGLPFPIMAGDIYVVNCGATHSFRADSELLFYNLMFHFSVFSKKEISLLKEMAAFGDFFKLKGERRGCRPRKLLLPPPFAERFKTLFELLHKELREGVPGFRMNAKARLILLITEMCRTEPLLVVCRVEASADNQRGS